MKHGAQQLHHGDVRDTKSNKTDDYLPRRSGSMVQHKAPNVSVKTPPKRLWISPLKRSLLVTGSLQQSCNGEKCQDRLPVPHTFTKYSLRTTYKMKNAAKYQYILRLKRLISPG